MTQQNLKTEDINQITPGRLKEQVAKRTSGVRDRCKFILRQDLLSMVIDDPNLMRLAFGPFEDNSPLSNWLGLTVVQLFNGIARNRRAGRLRNRIQRLRTTAIDH